MHCIVGGIKLGFLGLVYSDIDIPKNNFPPTVHKEKALRPKYLFLIMMIIYQLDWDKLKSKIMKSELFICKVLVTRLWIVLSILPQVELTP